MQVASAGTLTPGLRERPS